MESEKEIHIVRNHFIECFVLISIFIYFYVQLQTNMTPCLYMIIFSLKIFSFTYIYDSLLHCILRLEFFSNTTLELSN